MEKDTGYIYLSSLANRQEYPDNIPAAFENKVSRLNLKDHIDYEVGLVNILYPSIINTISSGDIDMGIEVKVKYNREVEGEDIEAERWTWIPSMTIPDTRDLAQALFVINADFVRDLGHQAFIRSIPLTLEGDETLIRYEGGSYDRCIISGLNKSKCGASGVCRISIKFHSRLAYLLGLKDDEWYTILRSDINAIRAYIGELHPKLQIPPDYFLCYTDIVQPTQYGGKLINILDAIASGGESQSKAGLPVVYKPLDKRHFDSIALRITDPFGITISFPKNHSVTALLHIRPS